MNLSWQLSTFCDLQKLKNMGVSTLVAGPRSLNKFSRMTDHEFLLFVREAIGLGLEVELDWDLLCQDKELLQQFEKFVTLPLDLFSCVRVFDPGAIRKIFEETSIPLHLNLESGNHNVEAILGWIRPYQKRVKRITLSQELTLDEIKKVKEVLPSGVSIETQGLGRILLFHSPRPLLRHQFGEDREWIEAYVHSEEGAHKDFFHLENEHGSFLFLSKDVCLLDRALDYFEAGVDRLRIDQRFSSGTDWFPLLERFSKGDIASFSAWKAHYPRPLFKGLSFINKTDVLFPKLKNHRLQGPNELLIGEVIDVEAKKYTYFELHDESDAITPGTTLRFLSTEGKEKFVLLTKITDVTGKILDRGLPGQLLRIPYVPQMTAKSMIFNLDSKAKDSLSSPHE